MKIVYVERSILGRYYLSNRPANEDKNRREFESMESLLGYLNQSEEGEKMKKRGNLSFMVRGLEEIELENFKSYVATNNPRQKII